MSAYHLTNIYPPSYLYRYKAGEVIYSVGEESKQFYLILDLPPLSPLPQLAAAGEGAVALNTPPRTGKRSAAAHNRQKPEVEIIKYEPAAHVSSGLKKVSTKLTSGDYFGHKSFVSNKSHARNAMAIAISHVCVACIYPDEYEKWSNFRNLLIINEKNRIALEIEDSKRNFEFEKQKLQDQLEQLRINYKNDRKDFAKKLKEAEAEAARAIEEEYEAEFQRQEKQVELQRLADEAKELERIELKLIQETREKEEEEEAIKKNLIPEHDLPSPQRSLSMRTELRVKMYDKLFAEVASEFDEDQSVLEPTGTPP